MQPLETVTVCWIINPNRLLIDRWREALQASGFRIVEESGSELVHGRADFLHLLEQIRPSIIVFDVAAPYHMHWNFLRLIRAAAPHLEFVLTTPNRNRLLSITGPLDVIETAGEDEDVRALVSAVRAAAAAVRPGNPLTELLERDRTILRLVADGMTNRQIADRLALQPSTIRTYLSHIFQKLAIHSRAEAARLYASMAIKSPLTADHEPAAGRPLMD